MVDSPEDDARKPPTPPSPPAAPRRARKRNAAEEVRDVTFPVVLRGYDRYAVDTWRDQVAELIERLEEATPRDAAVRRALDEVGQETSAILQRAHESADEITTRSRSQAEGRLQRAESEAELTVREADERAERLEVDAQAIWRERSRMIDEMRQLADEMLGLTDDALERLEQPRKRSSDERRGLAAAEIDGEQDGDDVTDDAEGEDEFAASEEPTRITSLLGSDTSSTGRFARPEDEISAESDVAVDEEDEDTLESPAAIDSTEPRSTN